MLVVDDISIHVPRMGARRRTKAVYCNNGTFQSTYPVQGTPPPISGRRLKTSSFNPRAPCGAGRKWGGIPTGITQFQSTHPVGARQQRADICGHPLRISIHLPRVGQDQSAHHAGLRRRGFNPRAPRGRDTYSPFGPMFRQIFQPTCPVGRDDDSAGFRVKVVISIHAPRRARRRMARRSTSLSMDFNPPAPCGAGRSWSNSSSSQHSHFNPPAPCGAGPRPTTR